MIFSSTAHCICALLPLVASSALFGRHDNDIPLGALEERNVDPVSALKTTTTHSIKTSTTSSSSSTTTKTGTPTINEKHATTTGSGKWPSWSTTECASSLFDGCRVVVGTVQLHFWPTGTAAKGKKFPKHIPLKGKYAGITMTYPSVYYIADMISATDGCGNTIGPAHTNFVMSYNLSDVSTYHPYKNKDAKTRIDDGTAFQLELDDLKTDCPLVSVVPHNNHNTNKDGCNPVLEYRVDFKDKVANGAWHHCGRKAGGRYGIFDPPVPVMACENDDCGDDGVVEPNPVDAKTTTTTKPAPTAVPDTQTTAEPAPVAPTPTPSPTSEPSTFAPPVALPSVSSVVQKPKPVADVPVTTSTTAEEQNPPANNPPVAVPTTTQGGDHVKSAPGSPSPDNTPAADNPAEPSTKTDDVAANTVPGVPNAINTQANNPLNTNLEVQTTTTHVPLVATYHQPHTQPTSSVAAQFSVVSLGSSAAIVQGQSVSIGGQPITLSNSQVVSLASGGLVVNPQSSSGKATTIALEPAAGTTNLPSAGGNGEVECLPFVIYSTMTLPPITVTITATPIVSVSGTTGSSSISVGSVGKNGTSSHITDAQASSQGSTQTSAISSSTTTGIGGVINAVISGANPPAGVGTAVYLLAVGIVFWFL